MITRIACFALVIILAAWVSWMFRYETKIIRSSYSHYDLLTVLDRWDQKQTICFLEEHDEVIYERDCTVIGKSEMGLK